MTEIQLLGPDHFEILFHVTDGAFADPIVESFAPEFLCDPRQSLAGFGLHLLAEFVSADSALRGQHQWTPELSLRVH
jgi:hypothetical protein